MKKTMTVERATKFGAAWNSGEPDLVAGNLGTFEWDFVTTDESGKRVVTAGCDLYPSPRSSGLTTRFLP